MTPLDDNFTLCDADYVPPSVRQNETAHRDLDDDGNDEHNGFVGRIGAADAAAAAPSPVRDGDDDSILLLAAAVVRRPMDVGYIV